MGRIPSEMRTIPERIGDAQQADTGLLAEVRSTRVSLWDDSC